MKTYVIGFDAPDRDNVLELLRDASSDIRINRIEEESVTFTIAQQAEKAEALYSALQEEVLRHAEINWVA